MIQPGPAGSRLSSSSEIVFCPGAIRTGPQRNFRWRTPSVPRVVVIVPCEVRTVVARVLAPAAGARTSSATRAISGADRRAWDIVPPSTPRQPDATSLLNRFRHEAGWRDHAATGSG